MKREEVNCTVLAFHHHCRGSKNTLLKLTTDISVVSQFSAWSPSISRSITDESVECHVEMATQKATTTTTQNFSVTSLYFSISILGFFETDCDVEEVCDPNPYLAGFLGCLPDLSTSR